jgi:hypothetical protein
MFLPVGREPKMRIAARKILVPFVFLELGLLTAGANAEDAAHAPWRQPEQVARTVAGNPPASPANPDNYAIQNDLLTGSSLPPPQEPPRAGWMVPVSPSDPAGSVPNQLDGINSKLEVQTDPNEPKSIELSDGVRGKIRAKGVGALLGVTVGFW